MTIEDLCGEEIECICTKRGYGKDYYNLEKVIYELERFLRINAKKCDYELNDYNKGVNSAYNYTLLKLEEFKVKYNVK